MRTENNITTFNGGQFDQWTGFISFSEYDDMFNTDLYIGLLDDYRGCVN